jgi:hypothetical protein
MNLRQLITEVNKESVVCIRDYASNIIVKEAKFKDIPKDYLDIPVLECFEYGTSICGKTVYKSYEVYLSTINSEIIDEIKLISKKFNEFIRSFDNYRPVDVAITCRTLLEEQTEEFEGIRLIGRPLCLYEYPELPKRSSVKFSEQSN